MAERLRLGTVFPTSDIGSDPVAIRDYAQGAEELGFDHLIAYDHVLGAEHADRDPPLTGPYTEKDAFHEPFVLFGYLASVTHRMELVIGVLAAPQRQTALVAKQAIEVALLSQGRLRLGVGTGWNWVEYESLGVPFEGRGRRLEEQVQVLRRLWSEPLVTVHGEFHDIERAGLLPRTAEPIPVWFGGSAPVQLRRAARLGDGFLCTRADERARHTVAQLRSYLQDGGRSLDGFALAGMLDWAHGPEECVAATAAWREIGGTHIALRVYDVLANRLGVQALGFTTVDQHLNALAGYRRLVDPEAVSGTPGGAQP